MQFDSDTGAVLVFIVLLAAVYAYAKSMIPWWGIPAGIFMTVVVIQTVESLFKPPDDKNDRRREAAVAGAVAVGMVSGAVRQTLPGQGF